MGCQRLFDDWLQPESIVRDEETHDKYGDGAEDNMRCTLA